MWLPKTAKKAWKQIAPELERVGLLTKLDQAALALHCDSLGRYEEVCRLLQSWEDMIASTPNGYAQQSALFTIRSTLWKQVMDSAREFGLSPAARSRVKDVQQQSLPLDGWDEV